jgi:hypothetical protein
MKVFFSLKLPGVPVNRSILSENLWIAKPHDLEEVTNIIKTNLQKENFEPLIDSITYSIVSNVLHAEGQALKVNQNAPDFHFIDF